jgi:hypothetical protein
MFSATVLAADFPRRDGMIATFSIMTAHYHVHYMSQSLNDDRNVETQSYIKLCKSRTKTTIQLNSININLFN